VRKYKNEISLSNNERGIWDLDTIKGCKSGMSLNKKGCYGDCYAFKTANRYKIDFSTSVERKFVNEAHRLQIIRQIEKIDMPFIRIGCSGDPSENWQHTINIISELKRQKQLSLFDISSNKKIVIITRHWNTLTDNQLKEISKYNLVINTSVSALDSDELIEKCLNEYNRIKNYCKSILRVVTCDFNEMHPEGKKRAEIQRKLLKNNNIIDTVFRPSTNNQFLVNKIIKAKKMSFMESKTLLSKYNKKTFIGKCNKCIEQCGLNV